MLSKDKATGAILGYYVLHRAKSTPPWENKTIDEPGATSLLVEPLNEHTTYEFAMQAFNSKGVSKLSALMEKTTDQDSKCHYTYIFYNFYLFNYLFCFDFFNDYYYFWYNLRQSSFAVQPSVNYCLWTARSLVFLLLILFF